MSEIEVGEYVSRKEYMKKYDSNVGYALHIQKNIKKDDYARLNIGQIVKVIGIRKNNVNKKAIYYGIYDTDWFDSSAVENFSNDIIDLIEVGDYVNGRLVLQVDYKNKNVCLLIPFTDTQANTNICWYGYEDIKSIVTKEQFENISYKVGD